jgi:hypothetical protein
LCVKLERLTLFTEFVSFNFVCIRNGDIVYTEGVTMRFFIQAFVLGVILFLYGSQLSLGQQPPGVPPTGSRPPPPPVLPAQYFTGDGWENLHLISQLLKCD